MEFIKIKNELGLELIVTSLEPENWSPVHGGLDTSPLWHEYLSDIIDHKYHPHFELIKKAIEQLGWVGKKGCEMANKYWFVFSDDCDGCDAIGFSWRAWGDLMSAIVGKREGYMAYYC